MLGYLSSFFLLFFFFYVCVGSSVVNLTVYTLLANSDSLN